MQKAMGAVGLFQNYPECNAIDRGQWGGAGLH